MKMPLIREVRMPNFILALLIGMSFALSGCVSQTFWDARIDRLCRQDGGMTLYERVWISAEEYRRLGGVQGTIPLPNEQSAPSGYPFLAKQSRTVLSERDPRVYRAETLYFRASDGKVLGRLVRYHRVGGDLPIGDHHSVYTCPSQDEATAAERSIYSIEGFQK
jgi:hypothetical protein